MELARYVGLLAAIGLFLAFLNPFGSVSDVSLPVGIAYWVSLIVYGGITGWLIAFGVRRVAPRLPVWAYIGALSALMTVTVFPAVALAQAFMIHSPLGLEDFPIFMFYILLIDVAVISVIILGSRAFGRRSPLLDPEPAGAPPPPATATATPASTFVERLPIRMRSAELYAIESEDHYLRVHTSAGQELILMRLADAVRELAGVEGLQTHRSWWVAKQGLADVKKGDGRLVLKLKSGAEAPVSRTFQKTVKEAGWM